jgi:hypothetical protein
VILLGLVGVAVLGGAGVVIASQVGGDDEPKPAAAPSTAASTAPLPGTTERSTPASTTAPVAPPKPRRAVVVVRATGAGAYVDMYPFSKPAGRFVGNLGAKQSRRVTDPKRVGITVSPVDQVQVVVNGKVVKVTEKKGTIDGIANYVITRDGKVAEVFPPTWPTGG